MIIDFLGICHGRLKDQGRSRLTIAIKNRPYTTLYESESTDPYLSLVSDFQAGVSFVN